MAKAGNVIKRWGKYLVVHDQQHVKDRIKVFKPDTLHGEPFRFPSCKRCGVGYPLLQIEGRNFLK
jgi:hypothetical protein